MTFLFRKSSSAFFGIIAVLSVLAFSITGFAASVSNTPSNAGQGTNVIAGYSASAVTFGGEWLTNGQA
jgi:hypothetical protein